MVPKNKVKAAYYQHVTKCVLPSVCQPLNNRDMAGGKQPLCSRVSPHLQFLRQELLSAQMLGLIDHGFC